MFTPLAHLLILLCSTTPPPRKGDLYPNLCIGFPIHNITRGTQTCFNFNLARIDALAIYPFLSGGITQADRSTHGTDVSNSGSRVRLHLLGHMADLRDQFASQTLYFNPGERRTPSRRRPDVSPTSATLDWRPAAIGSPPNPGPAATAPEKISGGVASCCSIPHK